MEILAQRNHDIKTNNEDKWHIYYPSKANDYGVVVINSQSEIYIQIFEMLDIGSNNTDEVLNILGDY